MKSWKYMGHLIWGIGVAHVIFALVIAWDIWVKIAGDGFFNAIGKGLDRSVAFWFMYLGIAFIPLGHLCQWLIKKRNAPLPRLVGVHFT